MISVRTDSSQVAEALRLLGVGPGHVAEVRALGVKAGNGFTNTWNGYFDSIEAAVQAVVRLPEAHGIYVTLNPCNPDLLARRYNRLDRMGKDDKGTSDGEITSLCWLPIDLDPIRPSGISSSDEEHDLALARGQEVASYLSSQGWPAPVVADSGNGGHLLYRVDLPVHDSPLVKQLLEELHQQFSDPLVKVDTSVFNPSRIWKLYGTPARKGDSTLKRPHRLARLLFKPEAS